MNFLSGIIPSRRVKLTRISIIQRLIVLQQKHFSVWKKNRVVSELKVFNNVNNIFSLKFYLKDANSIYLNQSLKANTIPAYSCIMSEDFPSQLPILITTNPTGFPNYFMNFTPYSFYPFILRTVPTNPTFYLMSILFPPAFGTNSSAIAFCLMYLFSVVATKWRTN